MNFLLKKQSEFIGDIQNEISEEHAGSKTTKDKEGSIKEKLPDQQQQGITGT